MAAAQSEGPASHPDPDRATKVVAEHEPQALEPEGSPEPEPEQGHEPHVPAPEAGGQGGEPDEVEPPAPEPERDLHAPAPQVQLEVEPEVESAAVDADAQGTEAPSTDVVEQAALEGTAAPEPSLAPAPGAEPQAVPALEGTVESQGVTEVAQDVEEPTAAKGEQEDESPPNDDSAQEAPAPQAEPEAELEPQPSPEPDTKGDSNSSNDLGAPSAVESVSKVHGQDSGPDAAETLTSEQDAEPEHEPQTPEPEPLEPEPESEPEPEPSQQGHTEVESDEIFTRAQLRLASSAERIDALVNVLVTNIHRLRALWQSVHQRTFPSNPNSSRLHRHRQLRQRVGDSPRDQGRRATSSPSINSSSNTINAIELARMLSDGLQDRRHSIDTIAHFMENLGAGGIVCGGWHSIPYKDFERQLSSLLHGAKVLSSVLDIADANIEQSKHNGDSSNTGGGGAGGDGGSSSSSSSRGNRWPAFLYKGCDNREPSRSATAVLPSDGHPGHYEASRLRQLRAPSARTVHVAMHCAPPQGVLRAPVQRFLDASKDGDLHTAARSPQWHFRHSLGLPQTQLKPKAPADTAAVLQSGSSSIGVDSVPAPNASSSAGSAGETKLELLQSSPVHSRHLMFTHNQVRAAANVQQQQQQQQQQQPPDLPAVLRELHSSFVVRCGESRPYGLGVVTTAKKKAADVTRVTSRVSSTEPRSTPCSGRLSTRAGINHAKHFGPGSDRSEFVRAMPGHGFPSDEPEKHLKHDRLKTHAGNRGLLQ